MKTKKIITAALLIITTLSTIACSDKNALANTKTSNMPTVSDVFEEKAAEELNDSGVIIHPPSKPDRTSDTSSMSREHYKGREIDVDLTTMNPMLVFGEVFNMVENPHNYIGKVIKFEGYYTSIADIYNGKYYFFVSIEDALACCAQGMEFIFEDDSFVFPDDYPADGSYVEIVGEFDVYEWQGYTFFRVVTDGVTVL